MRFHWMHRYNYPNNLEGIIKMSKDFEASKVYSILLPYGSTGLDYMMYAADLMKSTNKIKFMIALRPYSVSPEYAAKMFQTIYLYGNRIIFNLVAGKFSPEEEEFVLNNYVGDISLINTIEKRIILSDIWQEKFVKLMGDIKLETYTIANSPLTMELGKKHADYLIFDHHRILENSSQANGKGLVLIIDPLILNEEGNDKEIEYLYQPTNLEKNKTGRKQNHYIKGTMKEVVNQINDISEKFGINDFMVVTDQKDIKNILKLIEIMS